MANFASVVVLFLLACAMVMASPVKKPAATKISAKDLVVTKAKEQFPPGGVFYISNPISAQRWPLNSYATVIWGYYSFPQYALCETIGLNIQPGGPSFVFPSVPCYQLSSSAVLLYPNVFPGAYNIMVRAKNQFGYLMAQSQPVYVQVI